jgi:hypothetical protein
VTKVKQQVSPYAFVMFSFSGSYASMLSKQRYLHARMHEQIPLYSIDVRTSPQLYAHFKELFPRLLHTAKIPIHICFKIIKDPQKKSFALQPIYHNSAPLGDAHFAQLHALVEQTSTSSVAHELTI